MNPILIKECSDISNRIHKKFPYIDRDEFFQELQVLIIVNQSNNKYVSKELLEFMSRYICRKFYYEYKRFPLKYLPLYDVEIPYDPWTYIDLKIDFERSNYTINKAMGLGMEDDNYKRNRRRR